MYRSSVYPGPHYPNFRCDSGQRHPNTLSECAGLGQPVFISSVPGGDDQVAGRDGDGFKRQLNSPMTCWKTATGPLWPAAGAESVVVYRDESDNTAEDNTTVIGKLGRVEAATTRLVYRSVTGARKRRCRPRKLRV